MHQLSSKLEASILMTFGLSIQKTEFACFSFCLLFYQLFIFQNRTPKITQILTPYLANVPT